jgi:predicted nucleic acid-binding protein
MTGIRFLVDTNILIGLFKGNQPALDLLENNRVEIDACAYSVITRIELLGYPAITESEVLAITTVLQAMRNLPLTRAIEDQTIQYRRRYGLKTPDAIIAATAKVNRLKLLTLDQQLINRLSDLDE